MTISMIIRTIFEFALVSVTLWALFNEDKFVAFEERFACALRRKKLKTVNPPAVAVVPRAVK